jgi:Flp pilus assembly protein TadD
MGRVLEAKGDLAGARESYRRAATLAPGAETLRRLGRIELRLGDPRAACAALARAAASGGSPWAARWAAIEARQAGCPGAGASPR